jgi:hypothetical protein
MCQLHIILICVNCILFWQYVSTANYFDMRWLHIILTVCINYILFWQHVSTVSYFENTCQLHIILRVCVNFILFWQYGSTPYYFDSMGQFVPYLIACVSFIVFWQPKSIAFILTVYGKHIIFTVSSTAHNFRVSTAYIYVSKKVFFSATYYPYVNRFPQKVYYLGQSTLKISLYYSLFKRLSVAVCVYITWFGMFSNSILFEIVCNYSLLRYMTVGST